MVSGWGMCMKISAGLNFTIESFYEKLRIIRFNLITFTNHTIYGNFAESIFSNKGQIHKNKFCKFLQ